MADHIPSIEESISKSSLSNYADVDDRYYEVTGFFLIWFNKCAVDIIITGKLFGPIAKKLPIVVSNLSDIFPGLVIDGYFQ